MLQTCPKPIDICHSSVRFLGDSISIAELQENFEKKGTVFAALNRDQVCEELREDGYLVLSNVSTTVRNVIKALGATLMDTSEIVQKTSIEEISDSSVTDGEKSFLRLVRRVDAGIGLGRILGLARKSLGDN